MHPQLDIFSSLYSITCLILFSVNKNRFPNISYLTYLGHISLPSNLRDNYYNKLRWYNHMSFLSYSYIFVYILHHSNHFHNDVYTYYQCNRVCIYRYHPVIKLIWWYITYCVCVCVCVCAFVCACVCVMIMMIRIMIMLIVVAIVSMVMILMTCLTLGSQLFVFSFLHWHSLAQLDPQEYWGHGRLHAIPKYPGIHSQYPNILLQWPLVHCWGHNLSQSSP